MELARLVSEGMMRKGITPAELGRLIKPRNPGRGVEYVRGIESGAMAFPPLWALTVIMRALGLGRAEVYAALRADFQELNKAIDAPELEIHAPDGTVRHETLLRGTTPDDATKIMLDYVASSALCCTVVVSRLRKITVDKNGGVSEKYRLPSGSGLKVRNGFLVPPDLPDAGD